MVKNVLSSGLDININQTAYIHVHIAFKKYTLYIVHVSLGPKESIKDL